MDAEDVFELFWQDIISENPNFKKYEQYAIDYFISIDYATTVGDMKDYIKNINQIGEDSEITYSKEQKIEDGEDECRTEEGEDSQDGYKCRIDN